MRFKRFIAQVIDSLLSLLVGLMLVITVVSISTIVQGGGNINLTQIAQLFGGVALVAGYVIINSYPLHKSGQSVGKKLMRIKIVNAEGKPGYATLILRYAVPALLSYIPIVGIIYVVDALFIFRNDRRCLHDFACSTNVVAA